MQPCHSCRGAGRGAPLEPCLEQLENARGRGGAITVWCASLGCEFLWPAKLQRAYFNISCTAQFTALISAKRREKAEMHHWVTLKRSYLLSKSNGKSCGELSASNTQDKLGSFLLSLLVKQQVASSFLKCSVQGYDKREMLQIQQAAFKCETSFRTVALNKSVLFLQ